MQRYAYTHSATEAATGYYSCEPVPTPSIQEALHALAARPLDDFIRRHLLSRLREKTADDIAAALKTAFPDSDLPLALLALLAELALLNPALADHSPLFAHARSTVNNSGDNAEDATPLIFLRHASLKDGKLHRAWARIFNANQREHRALKDPETLGLAPLYAQNCTPDLSLPGLSPVFAAPFTASLQSLYTEHADISLSARPDAFPPPEEIAALAEERLTALGILAGQEMRHSASLSPVALLRPWRMRLRVTHGRHDFSLEGQATAYGRGLSLASARASCLMEVAERASVYLSVAADGIEDRARPTRLVTNRRSALLTKGLQALDPNDFPLETPYRDERLTWMPGCAAPSTADGNAREVLLPVQMAGLFCNLDEIALLDAPGSTGIAAGWSVEQARLAALLEILERDAQATTPFIKNTCFTLQVTESEDPLLAALLTSYQKRGINVQFQDLTGPLGVPVFKCFVVSRKGHVAAGFGAGLSARRALVSALTETPFPYPDGGPSGPLLRKLPSRTMSDLPDYSLANAAANLAMLEDLLGRNGRAPFYADLTHAGLGFPVTRAFVPGLELSADRDDFSRVPLRLYQAYEAWFGPEAVRKQRRTADAANTETLF